MDDIPTPVRIADIFTLPDKPLLDQREAARELGVSPRMMLALVFLRCGPPSVKIRSKTFWRREDVTRLRQTWMAAVRVSDRDRTAPLLADSSADAYSIDPLMRVLGQRVIRHRVVLSIFTAMILVGGGMSLVLI